MAAEPDDVWRRLHPVTILRELFGAAWSIVVPVVVVGSLEGGPVERFELLIPVLLAGLALGRYLSTRYAITADGVRWRRGVVFRRRLEIPRARIQNVSVGTDVLGRIFGVRTVTISTAGSEGEIELALVSGQDASFLLRDLLGEPDTTSSPAPTAPPASADDRLATAPAGAPDPVPSGPGSGATLPPVGQAWTGRAPTPPPDARRLVSLPARSLAVYAFTGGPTAAAIVVVTGFLVASVVTGNLRPLAFALVTVATPVLATLDLLDFQLTVEPDRVRVRSGLLRIRDRWARRERIQILRVSRPLVRAVIGYETISVATADPAIRRDADLSLCAPLARVGTWPELAAEVLEAPGLRERDLRPVSPRAVRRRFVRLLLLGAVPAAVPAAVLAVLDRWTAALTAGLVAGGALLWAARALARRAQRLDGYALDHQHLLVRRGMVGSSLWLVRRAKVQSVVVRATPFQHRLGLASLLVDTANVTGGAVVVPDLPRAVAEAVGAELVEHADRVSLPDGV